MLATVGDDFCFGYHQQEVISKHDDTAPVEQQAEYLHFYSTSANSLSGLKTRSANSRGC